MSHTALGDRMKQYEQADTSKRCMPLLPVLARLDGKCFSHVTSKMKRPYDQRMIDLMRKTTEILVKHTSAKAGHTQSDEISLVWYSEDHKSQIFHDGKIQKMVSVLASMTTWFFNKNFEIFFGHPPDIQPLFDCRVWQVPTLEEAANVFLWREMDAARNSVSMAARSVYSHRETMNKSTSDLHDMLMEKGINWSEYPYAFKNGSLFRRTIRSVRFTPEELEKLPEKHEARRNPDLMVERHVVEELDTVRLAQMENRVGVLFRGERPSEKTLNFSRK